MIEMTEETLDKDMVSFRLTWTWGIIASLLVGIVLACTGRSIGQANLTWLHLWLIPFLAGAGGLLMSVIVDGVQEIWDWGRVVGDADQAAIASAKARVCTLKANNPDEHSIALSRIINDIQSTGPQLPPGEMGQIRRILALMEKRLDRADAVKHLDNDRWKELVGSVLTVAESKLRQVVGGFSADVATEVNADLEAWEELEAETNE